MRTLAPLAHSHTPPEHREHRGSDGWRSAGQGVELRGIGHARARALAVASVAHLVHAPQLVESGVELGVEEGRRQRPVLRLLLLRLMPHALLLLRLHVFLAAAGPRTTGADVLLQLPRRGGSSAAAAPPLPAAPAAARCRRDPDVRGSGGGAGPGSRACPSARRCVAEGALAAPRRPRGVRGVASAAARAAGRRRRSARLPLTPPSNDTSPLGVEGLTSSFC